MKVEERDGEIVIYLELHEPTTSNSGKSLIIAGTKGTRACANIKKKGNRIRVNANVFYYKDKY